MKIARKKSIHKFRLENHLILVPYIANKFGIKKISDVIISIRINASENVESKVLELAKKEAEIIHLAADYRGMEMEIDSQNPRFIKEVIKSVHLKLVEDSIRDEVTIIASGGIAMAEHVPKAVISGADLTAVDIPLLIALGCRLYENSSCNSF